MGDYSYLYSRLSYWRGEASRLRSEIKKWKRHKKDVEDVQSALRSVAANCSSDVNSKITRAKDKLDRSIECPTKESMMDAIFQGENEKSVDVDSDLSNAKSAIQKEIRICIDKITELENDLDHAEGEIRRVQDMINSLVWG